MRNTEINDLHATNCESLRRNFEGREAVYVEKGVLRVRVFEICCSVDARRIDAKVEEIPTPGLEQSLFHGRRLKEPGLLRSLFRSHRPKEPGLLRWTIGAGFLTSFSEHTWAMGYGGWSLYFAPAVVSGFVTLAGKWPAELTAVKRYRLAVGFLLEQNAYEQSKNVFPD